jgi:hypothetical protein
VLRGLRYTQKSAEARTLEHVRSKKQDGPPGSPIAHSFPPCGRGNGSVACWLPPARESTASPSARGPRHATPRTDGQPVGAPSKPAATPFSSTRCTPTAGRPKKGMRCGKQLSTVPPRAVSACCGLRPWKFLDFGGRSTPAEEKRRCSQRSCGPVRAPFLARGGSGHQSTASAWVPAVPCARAPQVHRNMGPRRSSGGKTSRCGGYWSEFECARTLIFSPGTVVF